VTCTEFLAKMTDYFDGTVDASLLAELRAHLCECSHCEVVVNTTQQTIQVYRDHQLYEYEMPETLRDRIRTAIMAKCRGKRCK
jgi:predicted anti-sigma-YlaC factor YlaD